MVQSVSYLHIKPLEPYHSNGREATTLVPFDAVLNGEQNAAAAQSTGTSTNSDSSSEQADTSAAKNTSEAASEDTGSKKVTYRDPITGKSVTYIDVSEEDTSYTAKKTTSVDAMKETKYDAYFKKAAQRYGVSESLLKAIAKAESNFNARDVSSAGAKGVMQLMPETAKSLGVKDVFDPEQNIMGGAKCIKQKLKEFNGNVRLALAAYNAGSGAVKRTGGVPSYCKSYVNKVLSYKEAYETASAVG